MSQSNTPTFDEWMKAVDAAVSAIAFVSVHDLADQPFYDWWQSGYTPGEAARETLESEAYPLDVLYDESCFDDWIDE